MRLQPGSVGKVPDWAPEDEKDRGEPEELAHRLVFGPYNAVPAVREAWALDVRIESDDDALGGPAVARVSGYSYEDKDAEGFALTVPLEELACKSGEPALRKLHARIAGSLPSFSRKARKQAAEKASPLAQEMLWRLREMERLGACSTWRTS